MRLSHVRPGGLHLSEEAVKRSDYEIEHRPHGTVVWYSEPDGTPETCYTPAELEECHRAYLACARWSSAIVWTEDGEERSIRCDDSGLVLADDFEEAFYDDLDDFLSTARVAYLIGRGESIWKPGQVGHDFWLTRNGHGAGFWDRATYGFLSRCGAELTQLCKPYGSVDIYLDDDGHLAHDA